METFNSVSGNYIRSYKVTRHAGMRNFGDCERPSPTSCCQFEFAMTRVGYHSRNTQVFAGASLYSLRFRKLLIIVATDGNAPSRRSFLCFPARLAAPDVNRVPQILWTIRDWFEPEWLHSFSVVCSLVITRTSANLCAAMLRWLHIKFVFNLR